jgi:surface antigen
MPAIKFVALALVGLSVAACSSDAGPREVGSTVAGAAAGGLIGNAVGGAAGNRVAGTLIGAALGGLFGNRIGAALDEEDRRRAYAAEMWALEVGPSGAPVAWRNPNSGRYGNVVPGPAYQLNGVPCRQYTSTVYVDGRPQTERGTACRNPDGTWAIMG